MSKVLSLPELAVKSKESLLTLILDLQNRLICSRADQNKLQSKAGERAEDVLEEAIKAEISITKRMIINKLWRDFKERFGGLRSYRDTRERDYIAALHYIDEWMLQELRGRGQLELPFEPPPCFLCSDRPATVPLKSGEHLCVECAEIVES